MLTRHTRGTVGVRNTRVFDGATQYLRCLSNLGVTAVPLTMVCWFRAADATTNQILMGVANSTTSVANGWYLQVQGAIAADPIACTVNDGVSGAVGPSSATGFVTNVWMHAAGIFPTNTSRTVLLNGGNAGTESATTRTPSGVDAMDIASLPRSVGVTLFNGRIAWPAVWRVALSAEEIKQLYMGAHPLDIRRYALAMCLEMDGTGAIRNLAMPGTAFQPVGSTSGQMAPAPSWLRAASQRRRTYLSGPPSTGRTLLTDAGSYAITGSDVTFSRALVIDLTPGAYTITGSPADLIKLAALTLPTDPGAYALTGSPATLATIGAIELPTDVGSYTVTGEAALLLLSRIIATDVGTYVITGADAELAAGGQIAEPGSYVINGADATLVYSAALPAYVLREVLTRRMRRTPAISDEGRWIFHHSLQIDMETGVGLSSGQGSNPQIMLRWSDDGGQTWSNEHWTSAGRMGEYQVRAEWMRLGRSRDRVYETTVTDPVQWSLLACVLGIEGGKH